MYFKTLAGSIACALALILNGCVTSVKLPDYTQEDIQKHTEAGFTYVESHSYAWNVMKLAGFCADDVKISWVYDSYVDGDQYETFKKAAAQGDSSGLAGDVVIGSTLAATGALSTWTSPGLSLLSLFASSGSRVEIHPYFIGFLPKNEAENAAKAEAVYRKTLLTALTQAAKDLGFTNIEPFKGGISAQRPSTNASIEIDPSSGFVNRVWYWKNIGKVWHSNIPAWIDKNQPDAWMFGTFTTQGNLSGGTFDVGDEGGDFFSPNKTIDLKLQLLDKIASHLPDNFFLYVPSYERMFVSRDKKYTPNYVANNKGKFYFVMPESAKKQEQPK